MRILSSSEFLLSDPLPLEVPTDPRHLLSGCLEDRETICASLSILAKITSANVRLIGVLSQLERISSSLVSYERSLARRQRLLDLKLRAEESLAYLAAMESPSSGSPSPPASVSEQ